MNYQELQEAKQTFRIYSLEKDYKTVYKAREDFVRRFNPQKINSMTIEEYVIGKQSKTSFCYLIERKLESLGRITGQPSSKFGIWYSPEYQKYKYDPKFGNNYKDAFVGVKKAISNLLSAGEMHDYDNIIANPLNALIKGKILSVYYPEEYLNIFSERHLDYYLRSLNLDTKELMKSDVLYKRDALLKFKNSDKDMKKWSINMFAVFLWSHYPKAPFKKEDVAVVSDEEEPEFPTLKSVKFIDLQLASGIPTSPTNSHSGKPSPDYEKEAKKYKKLGDRGEYVVFQAEVSRLKKELSISESKAKELIKWVSRESDSYGYDIQSVNNDKTPRYIEVKATQKDVGDIEFYYTENEYETAKRLGKDYYIYVVFEILTPYPKVWVIKNPFDTGVGVKMKPVKYKVQMSTTKK